MADQTINDETTDNNIVDGDYLLYWKTASGVQRKALRSSVTGLSITGGGTIATGGFTLTVPATGTVVMKSGSGVAGTVAEWTDANTVKAGTIAKTGAGVLTLAAASSDNDSSTITKTGTGAFTLATSTFASTLQYTAASSLIKAGSGNLTLSAGGNYTCTIPATGTVGILDRTQTWTGTNEFSFGVGMGRAANLSTGSLLIDTNANRIGIQTKQTQVAATVPTIKVLDNADSMAFGLWHDSTMETNGAFYHSQKLANIEATTTSARRLRVRVQGPQTGHSFHNLLFMFALGSNDSVNYGFYYGQVSFTGNGSTYTLRGTISSTSAVNNITINAWTALSGYMQVSFDAAIGVGFVNNSMWLMITSSSNHKYVIEDTVANVS